MKILFLYRYVKDYDFDNWLHMKFIEYMKNSKIIDVVAYGPSLHEAYSSVTPIEYNPDLTLEELHSELKFDFVMCMTKSRMFHYYNPHTDIAKDCWLPRDFDKFKKTPKLVLEEDYHYEKSDKWYKEVGINLILQRHYNSYVRGIGQETVPMQWFPFSVDTTVFKSNPNKARIKKIGFAGTCNGAYPERQYMTELLRRNNVLEGFFRKEKIGSAYIDFLQSYTMILSGLSAYNITPAKMFEIIASGAILVTNDDGHLDKLFPTECIVKYRSDSSSQMSTFINHVKELLEDNNKINRMMTKGIECIHTRHSHDVRIKELVQILGKL